MTPERHHHRLELRIGLAWMADCLDFVTPTAKSGLDELKHLCRAEETGRKLIHTVWCDFQMPSMQRSDLRS